MKALKWLAVTLCLSTSVGCLEAEPGVMTVTDLRAQLARELPTGTPQTAVAAFLKAQKIEHSEYLPKERVIHGIVRNTAQTPTVTQSIKLEFHFDEAGKLTDYIIKEAYTGP